MAENTTQEDDQASVSRRRFVAATGTSGAALGLSGWLNGKDIDAQAGAETVTWGFAPVAVQENGEAIKQALHENGLPDSIQIEWVPGDQSTDRRRQNYNRLLTAGERDPDMFLMDNGWVNVFIQRGQIENLTNLLPQDMLSTIDEEYFESFTSTARDPESGDLYGVPIFPDFPTMQYRKDLVEQAGYSPTENNWATEPMTWEEWSNITTDVLDNSDANFGFTTQWDIYEGTACCTFNEVMSSWGGAYFGGRENLFGPVGDRPITVNSRPVIRSLNMMRKFVHDEEFQNLSGYAGGFAPTDILGMIEESSRAPFANGNAVMHRNWPYSLALTGRDPQETEDPALGEDLGAMPIPYAVSEAEAQFPGTGGTTAALGGWHATVNPNSQQKDAVQQVLQAAMNPDFQLELFSIQGYLPPRPSLFQSQRAQNLPVMGRYMDTLRVAGENTMPRPVTPVWNSESSAIAQQANRAVAQEMSASQAMQRLESRLQSIESEG